MKKNKAQGKRINNKKIMIGIGISLAFLCLIVVGITYYIDYKDQQLLKEIKQHYYSEVSIQKKTSIYKKKEEEYQKVGTFHDKFILELEKATIENTNQTYFKIKDSDYYVYYQDVKKGKKQVKSTFDYLVFNQNVVTKKDTVFYDKNKKIFHLKDQINLPLMFMDEEYYYVMYLDQILGIKKSESELVEHENESNPASEYISILHYGKIYKEGEQCKENTCISEKQLEKELAILKGQGFYTISLEEFEQWQQGFIRLKEKSVLLTVGNEDNLELLKQTAYQMYVIPNDYKIKFQDNNNKVTLDSKIDAIPRYIIKNNTSDDDYKKMLLGEEVKEVVEESVKDVNLTGTAKRIAVLNYHFFYDSSMGEQCGQGICLDTAKFEEQLKYLKNYGWKTLTMDEFRAWMYGEIELPGKSVLLTIDDGGIGTGKSNGNKLIPLLEKYQSHATIFLITGWYFPPDYQSPYLDIESHTNEMHTEGLCSGVPRGAQMLCSTREQVLDDLKKSISVTGSTKAFCYPFYAYNDTAVSLVQESGFQLAFQGGGYKATRSSNKFLIPRYAIHKGITMTEFINMIS